MSDNNYTTKSRKFQHLSKEKRAQIQILLDSATPKVKIAKMLGIARSTLYRELRRGSTIQLDTNLNCYTRYFYDLGQKVYEQNLANSKNSLKFAKVYDFIKYAEKQMLEKKLSPDAICGFVSKHKLFDKTVCSKTLYNYIDKCLLKVRNIDLALKVKLHTSKRKNRKILRKSGSIINVGV